MDTPEDVEAWVAEREREQGNGVAGLRAGLTRGIISVRGALVARAWLDEQDNGDRRRLEADQLNLARRSTVATERAAMAAVDAARHAGASVRWAKFAAAISVLALVVSAWAPVKDLLAPGPSRAAVVPAHPSAMRHSPVPSVAASAR